MADVIPFRRSTFRRAPVIGDPPLARRGSSSAKWRVEVAAGRVDLLVPFSGVKLTPDQARELARALVTGATDAEVITP